MDQLARAERNYWTGGGDVRHWHPDLPIPTIVDIASIDSRDCGSACTDSHEQSEIMRQIRLKVLTHEVYADGFAT